ncbi:MAG: hypothetical protein B7Z15_05485, partial [Rhizobiales bacterium 32-66-8]
DEIVLAVAELAANAVRHAAEPPTHITLKAELEGILLRLTIEDDGGPFTDFATHWAKASLAGTGADGTSGRGLALARSALDRVQYLPGAPNRLVAHRQLARRRPQLLVVEDDEILLDTYLELLEPHYRVLAAATLKDALALARETRVDLILTDFHLGTEPGTALVRALEDDSDRPPIPIVMITGDASVRTRALELGVDTFLTKPVLPAALQETVKLALVRAVRQRARMFRYFGSALEDLVRPVLPEVIGPFRAALRFGTADIGGGDLVVHLPRPSGDRIVLVDVMGHGINAKAGAVAHAAMIRALDVGEPLSPGAFLARWSNLIFAEPAFDAAIATALVVDLGRDGSIEIASAGHPHPMAVSRDTARVIVANGPLLGFTEGARYDSVHASLAPGERLLLATDGLDPAELASGGPCPDWLIQEVQRRADLPLARATGQAAAHIATRLGPNPEDDWVLILIERAEDGPTEPAPDLTAQANVEARDAVETRRLRPMADLPQATQPSDGDGVPDVDFTDVGALRRAVGEASFQRLAGRFVENVPQRLAQWEDLVAARDAEALLAAAHALAGVFGQFGLTGVAALAREVENTPDADQRLMRAASLCRLAAGELSALKAWLAKDI